VAIGAASVLVVVSSPPAVLSPPPPDPPVSFESSLVVVLVVVVFPEGGVTIDEMVVIEGTSGVEGVLTGGRTSVGRMLMVPVVPWSLTVLDSDADARASQAAAPAR
jgi:hypothetical protein